MPKTSTHLQVVEVLDNAADGLLEVEVLRLVEATPCARSCIQLVHLKHQQSASTGTESAAWLYARTALQAAPAGGCNARDISHNNSLLL
jgi:hypothetical protein